MWTVGIGSAVTMSSADSLRESTRTCMLVNELVEAVDDMVLNEITVPIRSSRSACIDEVGYRELRRCGTELLAQGVADWIERLLQRKRHKL